jgi:hypothetical protein
MPSTAQHLSTSPPPVNPRLLPTLGRCLRLRILVAVARGHNNELLQSCDLGATRGLTAAAACTDNVSTSISDRSFLLFLLPITTRNNIGFEYGPPRHSCPPPQQLARLAPLLGHVGIYGEGGRRRSCTGSGERNGELLSRLHI